MAKEPHSTVVDGTVVLNFCKFSGDNEMPLTIRLQEYPGNSDLWHLHNDFAELVIMVGGSVNNEFSDGSVKHMQTGDVLLMMPQSSHRYTRIKHVRHFNIFFNPEILDIFPGCLAALIDRKQFEDKKTLYSKLLHLSEKDLSAAAAILENMQREQLNFSVGHREAIFANFCQLIVLILRNAQVHDDVCNFNQNAFRMGKIIHYMETHSEQKLNISQLCAFAHMSESSFRHRFREMTGISPLDYLIRLRLRRAVLLIFHSDHPITQIALECGFPDGNYFARKFRQFFGCTPRDFRRKCISGEVNFKHELDHLQLTGGI